MCDFFFFLEFFEGFVMEVEIDEDKFMIVKNFIYVRKIL